MTAVREGDWADWKAREIADDFIALESCWPDFDWLKLCGMIANALRQQDEKIKVEMERLEEHHSFSKGEYGRLQGEIDTWFKRAKELGWKNV